MVNIKKIIIPAVILAVMISCGKAGKPEEAKSIDPKSDKGVGIVQTVNLGELDAKMAADGEKLFGKKCSACHKIDKRYIGPAIAGVTERRSPEWIMNMILDPEKMIQENAAAKQLLMEYSAPMANQSLKEEEARTILEYFRKIDSKK